MRKRSNQPCIFDGCVNKVNAKDLCAGHYKQLKDGKTLRPLQLQYHGLSEYDRFMKSIKIDGPDDCWLWTRSRMKANWHSQWRNQAGSIELAHRAAWRLMKGAIPDGMFVLHKCDNPICMNPSHLFLGTQKDNLLDMWGKGRARPKSSLGEKHGMSKLKAESVLEIRKSSLDSQQLACIYDVSPTTIDDVRKRKTWKHLIKE